MITKHGKPAAVVVPVEEAKQLRLADRPSFTALLMGIPMLSQ
jgi:antitoxin (DNA-binding transcriptional repressor) of toxin-antitoxin stability system